MTDPLDGQDVVWTSQSHSSADSMPCGGGGVGLTVWVQDGELLFYVDRSGSFDENNQMLKLGRVRVSVDPDPFTPAASFEQRLHLRDGHITVRGWAGSVETEITVWVDVTRPVVHVEVVSSDPTSVRAAYETWRSEDRELDTTDRMACFSYAATTPAEIPLRTHADHVRLSGDRVVWSHHNDDADLLFTKLVTTQHLDGVRERLWNPQRDFVFGGSLQGDGFVPTGTRPRRYAATDSTAWRLSSTAPSTHHELTLVLHADHSGDTAAWERGLEAAVAAAAESDGGRIATVAWWHEFWNRSHIVIEPGCTDPSSQAWQVGRNHQLFRHLMGCNAGGSHPSKFNGSLFTVDPDGPHAGRTPDFRAWGGGSLTAQNQRLLYFPLLASGDSDLLEGQLDFYVRALPAAELRTETYWGHRGASFAEQVENFGLPCGDVYESSWGHRGVAPRPGADHGALLNDYCSDQYDTVLEFCLMALDLHRYTGQDIDRYLPLVDSCVTFFDEHHRLTNAARTGTELDDDGRLVLSPGSACETYKDTLDATPTVAALHVVLTRLLELPERYGTTDQRGAWERVLASVPPLAFRIRDGRRTIAPARAWSRIQNEEFPQMYPVWPWRLYGVGRPDLEVAVDTFHHGADRPDQHGVAGWKQDPIFAACLGLTGEASAMVRAKMSDSDRRYPAFWGPNFDWTPDLNHAGSGVVALQEMLLSPQGRTVHLLPSWPREWDVDFRLHAPFGTVLEGSVRGGRLSRLVVTPPEREDDVVVHAPR